MCKDKNGKVRFSAMDLISSGKTGQTSATGTAGIMLVFMSVLIMLALVVMYFIKQDEAGNILSFFDKITVVLGIGAALLGTRKISGVIASRSASNIVDLVEDTVYSMEDEDDGHGRRRARVRRRKNSLNCECDDEGEVCGPDYEGDPYADNYLEDETVQN